MTELELLVGAASVAAIFAGILGIWWIRRRRRTAASAPAPATLLDGLAKTRSSLVDRLRRALSAGDRADDRLSALEEVLLTADVGVRATRRLIEALAGKLPTDAGYDQARALLEQELLALLGAHRAPQPAASPHVVMVSGVNGVGKTTSVAKLAHFHAQRGRRVLLVAADTFRAAATEQLGRWAERLGVDCIRHEGGKDPSAVVFDGLQAAKARGVDVVIIDTAGRLHVKENLIAELAKVGRVIAREVPGAPHESLLVIDATTGQNALNQARTFAEAVGLSGIVLTKLDGTAKGGVALAIHAEIGVPVHYVGFGEGLADFAEFDAADFIRALLGSDESPLH